MTNLRKIKIRIKKYLLRPRSTEQQFNPFLHVPYVEKDQQEQGQEKKIKDYPSGRKLFSMVR